ncbi:MAG: radical SAM family heme chaperone HemW [Rickettsiales bacterium]|nr:radical SAM family heme chaperone HemW [Rickettsiales bacterium]
MNEQRSSTSTNSRLALYFHWPFCKSKCPYCDFNSHVRDQIDVSAWKKALLAELDYMVAWMPDATPSSVFFGGGTPSLMPPDIAGALIDRVQERWNCANDIEITLEANPTSVEIDTFADFKAAGINRVSLGVQSFLPEALAFLGREHSVDEAKRAIESAAKHFHRYSFDLIYARPDQTVEAWEHELRDALAFADAHLSLYQLTIEQQTAFYHAYYNQKAFELPDESLASDLFLATQSLMESAGLPAYEVSNHARLGEESRHNLSYWRGDAYLGIGPGAHGRPIIDGVWHGSACLKSPERWLENTLKNQHGIEILEPIDGTARAQEYLMMGLRLAEGIDVTRFDLDAQINTQNCERYVDEGLLEQEGNMLRATHAGWLVLNQLIADLLDD